MLPQITHNQRINNLENPNGFYVKNMRIKQQFNWKLDVEIASADFKDFVWQTTLLLASCLEETHIKQNETKITIGLFPN